MNIAQITPRYYPSIGGVESVVRDISEELARRQHKVDVLTTFRLQKNQKKILCPKTEIINGVSIYRYSNLGHLGHMSFFPGAILRLLKTKYDVIHMHSLRHPHTVMIPLLPNLRDSKKILHGHSHFQSIEYKTRIYKMFDKLAFSSFYKNIDGFLVLNNNENNEFLKFGIDKSKIFKLYNPLNNRYFELRDSTNFMKKYKLEDSKIIMFLGQAHKGKRIDLIIKALPLIVKEVPNVKLLIAGPDFGNYSNLKSLAFQEGVIDYVLFLGELDDNEKLDALNLCDILVLPSEYEAFGMVLAEAMAFGKPVIATKTPGPLEIVRDNYNGFLINKDSPKEIFEKCIQLIKDTDLMIKLGNNARKYAINNFSIVSIVNKLEEIYTI